MLIKLLNGDKKEQKHKINHNNQVLINKNKNNKLNKILLNNK